MAFFFEEFGMFSQQALIKEFCLDKHSNPFFGLQKTHLILLFDRFKTKGWIKQRAQEDIYYSLSSQCTNPLIFIQKGDVLSLVSDLPISTFQRDKVVKRLSTFFFQIAHASFLFSWKSNSALMPNTVKEALMKEKESHYRKMIEAQFSLDQILSSLKVSLTAVKRKYLFHQLNEAESKVCQPLIRYLFHKTELQHIDNVLRAPVEGERNQIELLSTPRQYSIDLLLKQCKTQEESEEQIIQLAFLLFEESYGARCNPMQVKLFSSLMGRSGREDMIDAMQARMGFGKTALLPLLSIVQIAKEQRNQEKNRSIIRYVVPKAVLQDNAQAFHARISHILGANVIQDCLFSRYQIDEENNIASLLMIQEDLTKRLAFYQAVREQGDVLIQSPEIRQSMEAQELSFGFLALQSDNDKETLLYLQCKQLLGQIRALKTFTIFDELDATQDFKSCEVNFTEGKKLPILEETIAPLEKLVTIVPRLCEEHQSDLKALATALLVAFEIEWEEDLAIIDYLIDPMKSIDSIHGLGLFLETLLCQEQYAAVFLIRALLLDPNILDFICKKEPNTHFGVRFIQQGERRKYFFDPYSESFLLICVPYEGTNTPKGLSNFDNTEVAAITTLRYYRSQETLFLIDPHLDFLIKQTQKQSIPSFVEEKMNTVCDDSGRSFNDRLRDLAGLIDPAEREEAKKTFYNTFLKNPSKELRSYFGLAVVATQVRTDEGKVNSNRYEMGSIEDQIRGCSGTIGSTSSYFTHPFTDPAADGKLSLEIMGREENASIATLPPYDEREDYLDYILSSLLDSATGDTRAIIDAAGICKSQDGLPETIVKKLWDLVQNHPLFQSKKIKGIVYYGKDNIKRVYQGPTQLPIPCTTQMELAACPHKEYFSFYGQKNTRGSDIKQGNGSHALVTMDENVPNNDAKQAVLRFRNLVNRSSKQTFTFVLTERFTTILKKNQRELDRDVDAKDVVKYLRQQEKQEEERNALIIFRKELQGHVKQAATIIEHDQFLNCDLKNKANLQAYKQFLQARDRITPILEKNLHRLEDKYGQQLQVIDRDRFIQQEKTRYNQKINELMILAQNKADRTVKKFFSKRIDQSTTLFENRYPTDKRVCIASIDSGAEAIAQAQAQAEAEAIAETVVEAIAETIITCLDRLAYPQIKMAQNPHIEVDKEWLDMLTKTKATSITKRNDIKYLIHPNLHDRLYLSPQLSNNGIASQFLLFPQAQSSNTDIFLISQEEAEQFLIMQARHDQDHQLVDLRQDSRNDNVRKLRGLCVQPIEKLPSPKDTATLRKLELQNVPAQFFLPHLTIKGKNSQSIAQLLDLGSFGIRCNGMTSLTLRKSKDCLSIQYRITAIEIPFTNPFLATAFEKITHQKTDKLQTLEQLIEQDFISIQNQIKELEHQQQLLKGQEKKLKGIIQDSAQFTIDDELKQGLLDRDAQFKNFSPISVLSQEPMCVKECGKNFLNKIEEILALQQNLSSKDSLQALLTKFGTFASNKTLHFKKDIKITQLFDKEYWDANRNDSMLPFELVYGRILYLSHGGDMNDAINCSKQDCKTIFNTTLPALIKTIKQVERIIQVDLPKLEKEIEDISVEIVRIQQTIQDIQIAQAFIATMKEKSRNLVQYFATAGLLFIKPQGILLGNPHSFWDRFHFNAIKNFPDGELKVMLSGHLPDYNHTIENMKTYQKRVSALDKEEQLVYDQHHHLLTKVLALAQAVEKRKREIKYLEEND